MTRAEALKKVRKLLGPKAAIEVKEGITSPDRRQAASEEGRIISAEVKALSDRMEGRRQMLLAADDLYQSLLKEYRALKKRHNELTGEMLRYRFTTGRINGAGGISFFHVDAQGDTWEEVIAKLKEKGFGK